MKKYAIVTAAILVVLAAALPLLAQEATQQGQGQGRQRGADAGGMMRGRQAQMEAIEAIEAELAKLKAPPEGMPERGSFQDMSDEQRAQMRQRFQQMREERTKSIEAIENQLARLKGTRTLTQEHDQVIEALQALHATAVKENAKETAAAIQKMIDEKNKAFEDKMAKLDMEPRRGGFGGQAGGSQGGQGRPGRGQPSDN